MKVYRPPKKKTPEVADLKRVVHAFQVVSTALVTLLRANPVVSEDELETVTGNVEDTLETVKDVLSRVLSLSESTELHRMSEIDLSVKFSRQQEDVLYLVDMATVMLERLRNLQHISGKQHAVLERYWRSVPVQHAYLDELWSTASSWDNAHVHDSET
jgi:hypothetical protein